MLEILLLHLTWTSFCPHIVCSLICQLTLFTKMHIVQKWKKDNSFAYIGDRLHINPKCYHASGLSVGRLYANNQTYKRFLYLCLELRISCSSYITTGMCTLSCNLVANENDSEDDEGVEADSIEEMKAW